MGAQPLRVALLGCGVVGSEVVRLLASQSDDLAARIGAPLELVAIGVRDVSAERRVAVPRELLTDDLTGLVARVDVAEAPKNAPALELKLYRRLLELNSTDLVYVAYGIDHDRIVLDAALELSTLDLNELDGVLANLDLAIAEQVPHLHELVKNG